MREGTRRGANVTATTTYSQTTRYQLLSLISHSAAHYMSCTCCCVRFVYTFIHAHICSAEDEEELESSLHGIEERLGTRLVWHMA